MKQTYCNRRINDATAKKIPLNKQAGFNYKKKFNMKKNYFLETSTK